MGQRVVTMLVDDMTGEELEAGQGQTIEFAYKGVEYKIDLTERNAEKFEKAMQPFIAAASRIGGRAKRGSGSSPSRSKEELSNIRNWWREQGNEIGDRGRVPQHIVDAYHEAHQN